MIKQNTNTFGYKFLSIFLIIKASALTTLAVGLYLNIPFIYAILEKSHIIQAIFFIPLINAGLIKPFLIIHIILTSIELIIGINLFRKKVWCLYFSGAFFIFLTAFVAINPFYSEETILVSIPILALIIFYLYHHNVKIIFFDIPKDYMFVDRNLLKSRLVVLLSCFEIVVSLLLIRIIMWNIPLEGISIASNSSLPFYFLIVIPKTELLLLSYIFLIAGILTINYRPAGRMINIVLSIIGLGAGTLAVFLINQPSFFIGKAFFLIVVVSTITISFIYYFLLVNPNVKTQFQKNADINFSPRIVGLLTFGVTCFMVLLFFNISLSYYPQIFDTSIPKQIAEIRKP